jgi:hypothetical protein
VAGFVDLAAQRAPFFRRKFALLAHGVSIRAIRSRPRAVRIRQGEFAPTAFSLGSVLLGSFMPDLWQLRNAGTLPQASGRIGQNLASAKCEE